MAEQLGELTRTHTCGALRPDDVGADVVLLGWVHRVRDLGGLLFIDVRDRDGITQVVFDKDDEALMAKAKRLRSEYVVAASGKVRRRSADTVNPKLATGEVEVVVRERTYGLGKRGGKGRALLKKGTVALWVRTPVVKLGMPDPVPTPEAPPEEPPPMPGGPAEA